MALPLWQHLSAARLELEMKQVLNVLALLNLLALLALERCAPRVGDEAGAHFPYLISTKVRILTQKLEQAPHLEKKWKGMLKKQKKVYMILYRHYIYIYVYILCRDNIMCLCVCLCVCRRAGRRARSCSFRSLYADVC